MSSLSPFARAALALAVPLSLLAGPARADEPDGSSVGPAAPDRPTPSQDETKHAIDRTWLYGDDARVPAPLVLVASSSLSYTDIGNSPTRVSFPQPNVADCVNASGGEQRCYAGFAGNTAQPGGALLIGGELGLLPRISVQGNVLVGISSGTGVPSPNAGGTASLRVSVFPDSWNNAHLVLSGGYIREAWGGPVFNDDNHTWLPGSPHGDDGMFFQIATSGDVGRLRLAGMVHGEHIFSTGRDPLDFMVDLGVTYRVLGSLRAGLEYVGQDLEETFSPGAEGGARHFLGPIASLQLFRDRLTLVAGPSLGLSSGSPDFVARAAASYGF